MPSWWGTVLYPTVLVGLFLGLQGLLATLGVPLQNQASLAALPAVAVLLWSLPLRLRLAWGESRPWRRLGVIAPWPQCITALGSGLGAALLLLMLELVDHNILQLEFRIPRQLVVGSTATVPTQCERCGPQTLMAASTRQCRIQSL